MKLEQYLSEKERIEAREKELKDLIVKQNEQIITDQQEYKDLLKAGKEKEADELFSLMYKRKEENQSAHSKLGALKPIHKEQLTELAIQAIKEDVPVLRSKYEGELEELFKKLIDLDKQKSALINKQEEYRHVITNAFSDYEDIFDDLPDLVNTSAYFKSLEYQLGGMGSRLINEINTKVNKSEGRI